MTYQRFRSALAVSLAIACPMVSLHAATTQVSAGAATAVVDSTPPALVKHALTAEDIADWKSIRGAQISPNGQWFAYILSPVDGESQAIFRKLSDGRELRFPCGNNPDTAIVFSEDGGSALFTRPGDTAPQSASGSAVRTVTLVNLVSGEEKEFENVQRHSFSGRKATWLGMLVQSSSNESAAGQELSLHEIATGQARKIPNVADFIFNAAGDRLFYTTTAVDQTVSTMVVRNMLTGLARVLDSTRATYRFLALDNAGGGLLSAVRVGRDAASGDSTVTFVWVTELSATTPRRNLYEPKGDAAFPRGMNVNSAVPLSFTEDRTGFYFSIVSATGRSTLAGRGAAASRTSATTGDNPQSSLVVWHYRDARPQVDQRSLAVAATDDGFLMLYWHQTKKLLQLEDSTFTTAIRTNGDRWALSIDSRAQVNQGGAAGTARYDLHTFELRTGQRRMAVAGMQGLPSPSPDGQRFFFFTDGNYYVYELATGNSRNITESVAALAAKGASTTDEGEVHATFGWAADSKSLLVSDGWDLWKINSNGSGALNLTVNGRRDSIRYVAPLFVGGANPANGIDLRKPIYLKAVGEWSKKEGVARVDATKGGAALWLWSDAALQISRARDADVFFYTRQTVADFPDYYISAAPMAAGVRITRVNQQQEEIEWSAGARLIDYRSAKGTRLQGALYLPAGYQQGKSYPTVVVVEERLSEKLHAYTSPGTPQAFNPTVYTSRGYAVYLPDIAYTPNDPGVSAVECIVPAVEAAIASGIVDRDHIGLYGESWGGYETAFIITQTRIFAAAVAAAPLTNLVGIYSNVIASGGTVNDAVAGVGAGRFTSGYWENYDAYVRNSPVFHPTKVETPLLLEHDDREGVADIAQSIEFYNLLRALGKPVVMLQYTSGADAALRSSNQKDYSLKMLEFFDHYLKGSAAPIWWGR